MAVTLFDPYGRAVSSNSLFKTPSQRPNDQRARPRPRPKTYEAVSAWQRREMVDVSRVIASGVPNIDAALTMAGEFAIGDSWHVKSRSQNKAWGKLRDRWLNEFWFRRCNAQGDMYDWRTTLKALIRALKVEADYGVVFDGRDTADREATGRFSVIRFDRIGTGEGKTVNLGNGLEKCQALGKDEWALTGMVSGMFRINDPASPFDGRRIVDGVIVDDNLHPIGYRILGYDSKGDAAYADVFRSQMHFNFSGRRLLDQIRGIPELAESILPTMSLDDYDWLIGIGMNLAASLSVVRESADGNPFRANRSLVEEEAEREDGTTYQRKTALEEVYPGIVELATNSKESLKTLNYDRPSMNEQEQIKRVETALLHKLWPRSLIYPEEFARAGGRATTIQANTIITYDQCCIERTARWLVDRATEFAMRRGFVPMNRAGYDPFDYIFTIPGKFTIDEGNDSKQRLASLGRCTISRGIICAADGYLAEEIEEERAAEIDRVLTLSKKIAAKHPEWTPKEVALMFDHTDANVSVSEQTPPQGAEDDPPARGTQPKEDDE